MLVPWIITLSGCRNSAAANRVDPKLAESTLVSVLDSWRSGESISRWQVKDADVAVQDLDWSAGVKLKNYQILDSSNALDANLFCQVKLSLEDAASKSIERQVTYIVGTSPVRTVFRSLTP